MHIVYMYVYTCIRMYVDVHVCVCVYVCGVYTYTSVCSCEFMCMVVCYSVLDPFGEIRTRCRRPGPDSDSRSLWTRCIGDLKTVLLDDP